MVTLLLLGVALGLVLGVIVGWLLSRLRHLSEVRDLRRDAISRSSSVIRGQVGEQFAPFLPGFPAQASECQFLGKPVDYIAFPGLDEKNPTEIVFIEVKTGGARLSSVQEKVKACISRGKVRFEEYRVPKR